MTNYEKNMNSFGPRLWYADEDKKRNLPTLDDYSSYINIAAFLVKHIINRAGIFYIREFSRLNT